MPDTPRFEAVIAAHNIPIDRVTGEALEGLILVARERWGYFDWRWHRECLYADAQRTGDTSRSSWWGRQAGLTITIIQWR